MISNLTLVLLKEKFQNWELKFKIGGDSEGVRREVANLAGMNNTLKKAYGRKVKSGRGDDNGPKLCFNCGSPDHFKRDCPQPDQSE
jgi:hypothetical protein